jgi:K+-sensing histidine kinase KdpD
VTFTADGAVDCDGVRPDLQAIANLLAFAIDRCVLREQFSESRAAQRSEELKSALLSSVSHVLRTPLTAIEAAATSLQALRDTLTAEQEWEMLATITEQCAKLNRYMANLLDMGRIQPGISNSQLARRPGRNRGSGAGIGPQALPEPGHLQGSSYLIHSCHG